MQTDIRQLLRDALASVSEHYASLVMDPSSVVETYPAPFLKQYRIYGVQYFTAHKSILFYVGFALGRNACLLTAYPQNYVAMAREDGIVIDSPEVAVNYVTVYLEVTRSMAALSYLVQSVGEVGFRPNLTAEEENTKTLFMEKYRSVITSLTANTTASGYEVTAYVVREQTLERHTLKVSAEGDIKDEVSVLEQRLPLVYGL
jgi:hypothetical protein